MNAPAGGYDPGLYDALYRAEDWHFWFRARNQVISVMASQVVAGLAPGYRVLELGCGNGNVIRFLQASCSGGIVVGMDLFGEGLGYARRRGASRLVQGDVALAPFGKQFHLIGMFDVLEHISDDRAALRQVFDLLERGGTLLLTVPAHRELWSYFDEVSRHCRRYEVGELSARLREAGYHIDYLTQFMMPLYPLMWLSRRAAAGEQHPDASASIKKELQVNPVVNRALTLTLAVERRWLAKRWPLPMGTSLLAVARK
jgi:SAM-dependent methyltransferase